MAKVKVTTLPCKFRGVGVNRIKDVHMLGIGVTIKRHLLKPDKAISMFLAGPLNVVLRTEGDLFDPVEIKTVATTKGVGCRLTTYAVLLRLPVADVDVLDVASLAGKSGVLAIGANGPT